MHRVADERPGGDDIDVTLRIRRANLRHLEQGAPLGLDALTERMIVLRLAEQPELGVFALEITASALVAGATPEPVLLQAVDSYTGSAPPVGRGSAVPEYVRAALARLGPIYAVPPDTGGRVTWPQQDGLLEDSWTLSSEMDRDGWNTDNGAAGYGLPEDVALDISLVLAWARGMIAADPDAHGEPPCDSKT